MWAIIAFTLLPWLRAQEKAGQEKTGKTEPDILIFTDGEKLIGHLVRSSGASLTFHSDMAGDVTVEWSKIKELQTATKYAVIRKNVELHKGESTEQVPQGTLSATDKTINVTAAPGAPTQMVPVSDSAYVVDEPTFQKAVERNPGILRAWKGAITAGAALVEATQKSNTFTTSIALVRAIPLEGWLNPRNRTIFDFTASYGKLTQPNTPVVKTEIYHVDGERDEYFTARVFAFGQLSYDHNFSQGLDLQQTYGGGVGWTVIKNPTQTLDLKGSFNYMKQQFQTAEQNQNLIGTTAAEHYAITLAHKILITEQLGFTPALNNLTASSAAGNLGLTMPLYKRLSFALGAVDTFLNDPPAGFKKNSFQLTTGLTYTLQ